VLFLLCTLFALALIAVGTAVLHKFVAPPGARTVVSFKNGRARVKRGNVSAQNLKFVEDVLRQTGVHSASVGILPDGSLWFSPTTPAGVHQQLRNVLIR